MVSSHAHRRGRLLFVVVLAFIAAAAAPVSAQQPVRPEAGATDIAASIEFMNQYVFRGVRQNSTGMAMWPAVDLGITVHTGDGALKRVRVGGGFFNSLHTGDTGRRGPTGQLWYESRLSASLGLRFAGGVSVDTTYAAYTSPNEMFTTVKEVAVKAGVEGRPILGGLEIEPYAMAAFEVGAEPGEGQLDGGLRGGKYVELGIAPRFVAGRVNFTIPVTTGLSLGDYYELAAEDHAFGFATIGGALSVPLNGSSGFGSWRLSGGVYYHALGTTTKTFNGGDGSAIVGSIGLTLSH